MHTIAYITDIHLDEDFPISLGVNAANNWKQILQDLSNRNIGQAIFGGDIGDSSAHEQFFRSLEDAGRPFHIVLGNHDKYAEVIKQYRPPALHPAAEMYYTDENDVYKYIVLDSSPDEVSITQLRWLEIQLDNTEKKPVIFIHHPVIGVNTPLDAMYPLKNRDEVLAILHNSKKEVTIFCGHYHMEDEQTVGNIKQYITPAASYQIVKEAEKLETATGNFGYRLIHFESEIRTELVFFN